MPVIIPAPERIKTGQDHYKAGNLAEAAREFTLVAQNCSHCQAGKANKPCSCHDLLSAFRSRTLSDVLRAPCKCPQRAHKRCKDESHVAALASLVMVAVRTKDFKLGLVYAQNLVYLAPRDPRAYLRLAQVLRLTNRLTTALSVYQQGLVLVAKADPHHPGLQPLQAQAAILAKQVSQIDPIEALPAELIVMVLRHLTTRRLCYCLRVSKTWKRFLESSAASPLWAEQYFDLRPEGSNKPIKLKSIQRYLVTYPGGHLRSLLVDNCAKFITGERLFTLLRACPQLEELALSGCLVVAGDMPPVEKMPKLRSLFLGPHVNLRPHHLDGMVTAASNTLEELNVLGFPSRPFSHPESLPIQWPQLPRLHTIRISGPAKISSIAIDMVSIMQLTPNVHTVWVEHVSFSPSTPPEAAEGEQSPEQQAPEEQASALVWPNLQRLYLGPCVWIPPDTPFPLLSESVTELVVEGSAVNVIFAEPAPAELPRAVPTFSYPNVTSNFPMLVPSLPRLETLVLSARYPLTPEAFRALTGPAFENDTLRHLHLSPFPWAALDGRASPAAGRLAQWARPAAAAADGDGDGDEPAGLTSLGVSGLMGEVGQHVADAEAALRDVVGLFPRLRDLDVGRETAAPEVLGRVLEGGVRALYHDQGPRMLELKEWAVQRGKTVVQAGHPATKPGSRYMRAGPWIDD